MALSYPIKKAEDRQAFLAELKETHLDFYELGVFSLNTALRFSDVSTLEMAFLVSKLNLTSFTITQKKTKQSKTIHWNDTLRDIVKDRAKRYPEFKFCFQSTAKNAKSKEPRGWSSQYLNRVLKKVATEVGITKNISSHSFRKTLARQMFDNGEKIENLQRLLGHSSQASVLYYIAVIDEIQENLAQSYEINLNQDYLDTPKETSIITPTKTAKQPILRLVANN